MAFPRSFIPLVQSTRFWTDYLFLTDTPLDSPYKDAFLRANDDSDDEEYHANQTACSGSDDDSDNEGSDTQNSNTKVNQELENGREDADASDEKADTCSQDNQNDESHPSMHEKTPDDLRPLDDDADDDEDNHSCSSSSSSSSGLRRSRSYFRAAYQLSFPFNRNLDPTDDTFRLTISLDSGLSYVPLDFSAPDAHRVTIAHDDQAHWHPFVLRWEELEAISQAVGLTFSSRKKGAGAGGTTGGKKDLMIVESEEEEEEELYRHPGLPLLFLYRFAPICLGDDAERIAGMLAKAYKKVLGENNLKDRDLKRLIERMDCRKRGFRWFIEEDGNWWIGIGQQGEGEDEETAVDEVYTYRSREAVKSGKWMNEQWNAFVEEAKKAVAAGRGVGNIGGSHDRDDDDDYAEKLEAEYRELGKRFHPREQHGLDVRLPLTETDRPMHERAGRYFCLTLDCVLRILDLGTATSSGGGGCMINGQYVNTFDRMSVNICGNLARGRAIIKQMLWWLGAPSATTLGDTSTYDELPFDLAEEQQDKTDEVYLGICVPDVLPDCDWLVGHTLPDSLGTTLESKDVLGDHGQVTGPTSDGWLTVTTSDGGELGFNFSRFDDEKIRGTGAIALRRVTTEASAVLHAVMEASGAVLTPVGITAKPLSKDIMELSWPPHRVVDAANLHEVLSAGAFDYWKYAERMVEGDDDADSDGESSTPQWV